MKILITLFVSLFTLAACAQNRITATITVTNLTVNGNTLTVNGNVRTFTNNVVISSTQVATNADATGSGSKTNLFAQIGLNLFSGITPINTGSNTFQLQAACGGALVVSASAGWASVSYSTQTCATATPVGVPFASYYANPQVRSNAASQLEDDLLNYTTNSKIVDLSKAQTVIGPKTFSSATLVNPNINGANLTNEFHLIDENGSYFRIFSAGNKLTVIGEDGAFLQLTSDGTLSLSNLLDVHGDIVAGTIHGSPIIGDYLGDAGALTNLNANAITNPIPSTLLTNRTLANEVFTGVNGFAANSDIAFARFPVSSLANGNNAAVPVGTNVFIEVSGPSADFTINGIAGGRDGKLILIVNQTGFNMTIAHQSGTDPTAANRIISMTGSDRVTTGNGAATLIYSGSASRWLIVNFDP